MVEMNKIMKEYFVSIDQNLALCYDVANRARAKGFDPDTKVEIPLARNMAERVENLLAVVAPKVRGSGVSERIIELEGQYGSQNWRIAFFIAEDIANEKFCKFDDRRSAIELGLRAALAYITNGVVSSPLEGFIRLELKKRRDNGKEYFCLYFGGPIRSAGTTAICIFAAACDYVRVKCGYATYDPSDNEIKRTFAELEHFHDRITNLQYFPSEKEAEFITKYLPLQIDGDASEKLDVPNYKDLPRIYTNKLRNGFCLVMAEGLCQKLAKFWSKFSKWYKEVGMDNWVFLDDFVKLQKETRAKGAIKKEGGAKIVPDYNYIKDIVAGRPVLGYPLRVGAFRARLGRARTTGLSDDAIHPATMHILDNFIAYGTQLKSERPGKSTTIAVCDEIEGPIVKLRNGNVVFIDNEELAKKLAKDVEEILFMGDILINYGYFLDRGHVLAPVGYNEDWWVLELEKALGENKEIYIDLINNPNKVRIGCETAITLSKEYSIPLYPTYTYHFGDISLEQFTELIDWLNYGIVKSDKIILPIAGNIPKRVLELIGCPHLVANNEYVVIEGDWALGLRASLGFYSYEFNLGKIKQEINNGGGVLDIVNRVSEVNLRDKSGLCIGSRMGRPEKAKMRKLTGTPHALFPIGKEGGRLRCFQAALEKGKINAQFPNYLCKNCGSGTIYPKCHKCGEQTEKFFECRQCDDKSGKCKHSPVAYSTRDIAIKEYFDNVLKLIGTNNYPELIKGVRGTSNKEHIPEHLIKGVLRAIHNIYVNKDGTTRYDMTEMSLTHFKPKEIGTSIEVLKELGYTRDVYGNGLVNDEQILELRCQDIILPSCPDSLDEGADFVLFRVANFVDDLLEKLYGLPRFYNLTGGGDIVGHLVIGLSPHTAAGIVGRIVGFSKTQTLLASPLFHSIMRRDCDGDEACVILLMDALLNFSPKLLSNHRGATQDEPLVLTSMILPAEVDDMVFNMDIVWKYPLELYAGCLAYKSASDVAIKTLRSELGKEGQYSGWGFTHDTTNFNSGVMCSSYKTIPTMQEKVERQMALSSKIRAVDASDVARLIIERHFIRDIRGNLRKFSQQQFRCVNCNEKYRRPPLKGNCIACNGNIIFTVSEGSVVKYLGASLALAEKYNVPLYLKQSLELANQRVELMFGKEREKQEGLGKWFETSVVL